MTVAYLAVFATIASAFRLYRCIWVLENVVAIVTAERGRVLRESGLKAPSCLVSVLLECYYVPSNGR